MVLEAGEFKTKVPAGLFSPEASLLGGHVAVFPCVLTQFFSLWVCLCPHLLVQGHQADWIRVSSEGAPCNLITSLKALPPNRVLF